MKRVATTRTAISLPEVLAAAAIVGVLIAFVSQFLIVTAAKQQATDRRALAMHEISNVAQRIAMLSYEETTLERLQRSELSPGAVAALPAAELSFEIESEQDDEDEDVPAKRIGVSMTWTGSNDEPARPVRLVIWKHPQSEVVP